MNRYAAAAYRLAPVWGQNLLLTAYGVMLERERYRGRFAEFRDLLATSERWSASELEAYQDERLREIVSHAYATVPFYRRVFDERKLTPADIRGRADLPKLPLLTKDHIRRHAADLWSAAVPKNERRSGHTSGTTGTPLTVGYDRDTVWMTYAVFDRHYRWAGLRMARNGDRIAVVRGNVIVPLDQREPPFWRYNRQQNQMLLSSFHLSRDHMPAYFGALDDFQPDVLDGYPSTLYLLAKYLQTRGEFFAVRAVVSSSETLYPFQREVIEERFKTRVFDYFALAERAVFSGECERHEGHHVAMEYGLAEVTDEQGAPLPKGQTGRLVGTTLHNRAMPLIRYSTNDMSALQPGTCSCGRGLELMAGVTTKAEDVLTLADGRLISPSVLTHPFKPLESIEGSQIVQTAPDAITVRLIRGDGYTDDLTQHLVTELQARLGGGVRIDVEFVQALEHSPNGKFKWVISRVPLGL